jgi:hypothetical protein
MKEIREAVGWAKAEVELLYGHDDVLNKNTKEMLNILIDLAEKVLAVGVGLSRTEISQIISQDNMVGYIEACGLNGEERQSIYDRIALAIHSAQMEKLGGVK